MKVIRIDSAIGQDSGELSARWLRSQLPTTGEDVTLQIHCEGGSVLEGFAMLDILAAYPGRVKAVVSSMALSMASALLTGCDSVEVTPTAYCMLHNAHMNDADVTPSEEKLLNSLSEKMVKLYSQRMKKPAGTIRKMMASETFLDASQAVSCGLADRIVDASRLSISARAIPSRIVAKIKAATPPPGSTATTRWRAAVDAKALTMPRAKAIMEVDKSHPGLRQQFVAEFNKR